LPQRNQGHVIITDRYMHSTLAYQQTQGIPLQQLLDMHEHLPHPDITFLFDIDPKVAAKRIAKGRDSEEKEMFDRVDFQARLRTDYRDKWEGTPLYQFIRTFVDKYIHKTQAASYEKELTPHNSRLP